MTAKPNEGTNSSTPVSWSGTAPNYPSWWPKVGELMYRKIDSKRGLRIAATTADALPGGFFRVWDERNNEYLVAKVGTLGVPARWVISKRTP